MKYIAIVTAVLATAATSLAFDRVVVIEEAYQEG
jgi:hypothetical protein